ACAAFHFGLIRDDRGLDRRRSHRKLVQAPCGREGQRQPLAWAWRCARSRRQCDRSRTGVSHRFGAPRVVPMSAPMRIAVLGSTGSIGLSTLDVLARHPDRFEPFALAARSNISVLLDQCIRFKPRYAVVVDAAAGAKLRSDLQQAGLATEVLSGA